MAQLPAHAFRQTIVVPHMPGSWLMLLEYLHVTRAAIKETLELYHRLAVQSRPGIYTFRITSYSG